MSLFENSDYRWRETCFVLLDSSSRPAAAEVRKRLELQFEVGELQADGSGQLEQMTVFSPNDFSAMDICFVEGEVVTEQLDELLEELQQSAVSPEDLRSLGDVHRFDARLDVLHFERVMDPMDGEEEFLDPGSLLVVLEELARLSGGVGVDPQNGTILHGG